MADQPSNETLKQMLSGFSAMQYNLGLLPMQQSQAMAGASSQFQAPPPPPPVPHPSEAAMQAMANHNNAVQQTLQAAQVTRYQPPPSAPMPSVGAMGGMSMMNPFAAPAMGGGGGGGGGFGGGGGGGGGPFVSAGSSGGFVGGGGFFGGGGFSPRMPSVFNPFAPTLPASHFASPAQRNMQMMQHAQSQTMGMIAGIGEAGLGIGGAVLGGMIGGPLGAFAGRAIGGAISGMIFNPVTQDYARGRQIQQMTSPFMVSGPSLNMVTGTGMDAASARQVATGIRHLQRDYDFERTGFNTQDTMRIMQTSAQQGLLTGAQSPDQMVQKVKEISKTVKMLMKITGDPDVQDAIRSLGQMREMGFQGLAAQAGAVANRASFARMAGVSQQAMGQIMAGGADMAAQYGLVGATGANAAMFGAGAANVAASSGALGDLQLARAGGRAGLGQLNARASIGAMANDQMLLAALGRGPGGQMQVDMDAFRRAQHLPFDEVQRRAAEALRNMGTQGIMEWNTRRNEFKDQIAQKLRPGEMQMMMLQQARSFQQQVPGMTLGSALQATTGMSADESRALEVQFQSRQYWQGMANQLRVQRREVVEQEKAAREQFRTPGLATRMGRGIRGALGSVSDTLSSPFRSISDHFERVREEEDAAKSGERISRYGEADIAHDAGEQKMLRAAIHRQGLRRQMGGGSIIDDDADPSAAGKFFGGAIGMIPGGFGRAWQRSTGRQINRMSSFLGLSSESAENRLAAVADYSRGRYTSFGETFGDPQESLKRVKDVIEAGQAASTAPLSGDKLGAMYASISAAGAGRGAQINSGAVMAQASSNVIDRLKDMKAGYIKSARAIAGSDVRSAYIEAATKSGMKQGEAEKSWDKNKAQIMAKISEDVHASGDKSLIEPWEKAKDVQFRAGAVDLARSSEEAEKLISDKLDKTGMGDISDKSMQEVKSIMAHHDNDTVAMATAIRARVSGNKEEKEAGLRIEKELHEKLGDKVFGQKQQEATALAKSMTEDTSDAFERTFRGSRGLKDVQEKLDLVSEAAGDKMKLAAEKEFKQKLDKVHKGAAAAGSVTEAVGMITEDELEGLDEQTRKAIEAHRKGDDTALEEAVAKAGPQSKTVRHSDASSDKLKELDQQIADYEEEASKAAGDMDPAAKLQADSTDLFAKSVSDFATAVKDLKGGSEGAQLINAMPWMQSQR